MKVLVLGDKSYSYIFEEEGWNIETSIVNLFRSDHDIDLVCFTGGTDVDPSLYNQPRHPTTSMPDRYRDAQEIQVFDRAANEGIPMVGICRGAQFLAVMNGGALIQHCYSHGRSHNMLTDDGREMVVTSSHHQMIDYDDLVKKGINFELLGFAPLNLSDTYHNGYGKIPNPSYDVEVVVFPESKSLCHQPHPEWMDNNSPYYKYFFETVDNLMNNRYEGEYETSNLAV